MSNKNINSVSYQFIPKDSLDKKSNSLTSSNYIHSIPREKKRPLTSTFKHFGLNSSNHFNKQSDRYDIRYVPRRKQRNSFVASIRDTPPPIKLQQPIELKAKEDLKTSANAIDTINSNSDFLQIRTGYILKFASNSEFFKRTRRYFDYLSEDKQGPVVGLYDHLRRTYELNNRVYFDNLNSGSVLDFETWKELIRNSYEYNSSMLKLIDLLFRDLKSDKDNILRLKKRNFELEAQITVKSNEITLINDFIKKNDLNLKLNQKKKTSVTSEEAKQAFLQKENAYVLTIYRLEDEIKALTALLEQNKLAATKLQHSKDKAENRKKTIDEMRVVYNKEINDLNLRNSILKEGEETLREQIDELDNSRKSLLNDVEQLKNTQFEINKKNQMYKRVIEQRLEIISMLHEESAMYAFLYAKEKQAHAVTSNKLLKWEGNEKLIKL